MTQQTGVSKASLVEQLRASGDDAVQRLSAVPEGDWQKGRYENGWNAREILAHISSIEWTYPRLIDLARGDAPVEPPKPKTQPTAYAPSGKILSYNDRQVEKRAEMSAAELIEEFRTNRETFIKAVEAADAELFGKTITSAGGITGPLATVIFQIAIAHVRVHVDDIVGR
jgi:hypothetical protein